jgi:IclR family transcriptional regulator, pca regulon regulatory protein
LILIMPARRPTEPAANAAVPERDLIGGLEKGLLVMAAFDAAHPQLSISEAAERCGLTRAAARRCLLTLQHLGFAESEGRRFALTPKVLRLAQSYMSSARLPRLIQPELNRLASTLKESSSAGVLEGDDVLCVAALSVGRVVSATLQPGTRVPAYCTANGRVWLAAMPPARADAWLRRQRLRALTAHTLTDPARLRREIASVRTQGYACVDQELEDGLRTISVPLHDEQGVMQAAINVSVQAAVVSADRLVERALPALRLIQQRLRSQFSQALPAKAAPEP